MSFRLELATGRAPTPVLRPATPDDAPRLVAMFERCSPASRYARFLAPLQHFPAAHLTDVVRSSPDRRSWVVDDLRTGQVVAVGSWFRRGDEAECLHRVEHCSLVRVVMVIIVKRAAPERENREMHQRPTPHHFPRVVLQQVHEILRG